jgi:mannose-6-phosphate isomerase-like protein (cupin superfamily)
MARKWKLINAENVEPYVYDEMYSSKLLTGDEMAGRQVININEGTMQPGGSNKGDDEKGSLHEETEIFYIIEGKGCVVLDGESVPVKAEDIIVIPGGVSHWIDNRKSDTHFRLLTFWPRQEQNAMYFTRKEAWGGASMRYKDPDYLEKRLKQKK